MRRSLLKSVPNVITVLNLLSGCLAIYFAYHTYLLWAAYSILLAALLDYLDGMIARMMNASSAFGKELDSLADIISFGLAPSVILFYLLENAAGIRGSMFLPFAGYLVVIFSAMRLARFNVNKQAEPGFKGLPVTASGIWIASYCILLLTAGNELSQLFSRTWTLLLFIGITCLLMISSIPMFSLSMGKDTANGKRLVLLLFLLISLVFLVLWKMNGLFFVMMLYIIAGMFIYLRKLYRTNHHKA